MHGETHEEKPLIVRVVMILLVSLLASAALLSNGFVLTVIGRFKSLRTVPNILLANLAVVDLLSAAINVPIYMISYVWEASWFRGKILAIISSSLNRLFLMLNLVSMLAMMINMYLAISFGLRYLAWKTKKKALICAFFIWFACIVMATLFALPLLDIDLGDAHVREYRAEIFEQAKYFVAAGTSILIICSALVSFLTACAIRRKRMKVEIFFLLCFVVAGNIRYDLTDQRDRILGVINNMLNLI